MSFDSSFIEQLKSKNDIVEVVSAYCNLQQKGGSYWACCPLPGHMEKTPSFSVNPTGQFFKCFGCGRGGDVIKFIMEIESLDYWEAVKFLANRAGLEVPTFNKQDEEKSAQLKRKKERLYALMKDTAHFYVDNLLTEQGKEHRDYLEKRGFSQKLCRSFGIGASLDYESLPKFLLEKGYTYEEMTSAGVVSYNKELNRYSDFEAKRLIVPIIDSFNNVIAFGGRVIWRTDFAKYKNTSETILFNKSQCLYNINNLKHAKRASGKLDYVIMVEGYMDTIALASSGIRNVVASMGTSLTQMQAKILSRYTDNVVICYDGDGAGQKATMRGLEILKDAGLNVKVISLPDGLDPDEFIKAHGTEEFLKYIDDASLLIDYKLEVLRSRYDITKTEDRRNFVSGAIKIIRQVEQSFEQEELLKKLSQMSGITYEYLRRDLEKLPAPEVKEVVEVEKPATNDIVKAERFLLCSIIFGKKFADPYDIDSIEFSNKSRTVIADYIITKADEGVKVVPSMLYELVGDDGIDELNELLTCGDVIFELPSAERYYKDCAKTLKVQSLNSDIDYLNEIIKTEKDVQKWRDIVKLLQNNIFKLEKIKTEDKA